MSAFKSGWTRPPWTSTTSSVKRDVLSELQHLGVEPNEEKVNEVVEERLKDEARSPERTTRARGGPTST